MGGVNSHSVNGFESELLGLTFCLDHFLTSSLCLAADPLQLLCQIPRTLLQIAHLQSVFVGQSEQSFLKLRLVYQVLLCLLIRESVLLSSFVHVPFRLRQNARRTLHTLARASLSQLATLTYLMHHFTILIIIYAKLITIILLT